MPTTTYRIRDGRIDFTTTDARIAQEFACDPQTHVTAITGGDGPE